MRGYFIIGIWQPKRQVNVGGLWRSAGLYGAASTFTIGARYRHQSSDTLKTPKHIPLHHYSDIDDFIEHLPHGCPLIGVELDPRAVPLTTYQHREKAAYLLGAEDHGLPADVLAKCHEIVQIPCALPYSMNVASAGSILMHDRYTKTHTKELTNA